MSAGDILGEARSIRDWIVDIRRRLHRHPAEDEDSPKKGERKVGV